ncbi:MAG: sugar transferase [Roseiflexaceae bacterium]
MEEQQLKSPTQSHDRRSGKRPRPVAEAPQGRAEARTPAVITRPQHARSAGRISRSAAFTQPQVGVLQQLVADDPKRRVWLIQRHARRIAWQALLALVDALLILAGFALAYVLRYVVDWPPPFEQIVRPVTEANLVPISVFAPFALALLGLLLALFVLKGLYRLPRTAGVFEHAGMIVSSTTTGIAMLIVGVFALQSSPFYSRWIFPFAWAAIIVLLCAWRVLLVNARRWRWTRGHGRERVLVVGGTGLGRGVMESLVAQPFLGYALVGYLDDREPPPTERRDGHFRYLGPVHELVTIALSQQIEQVILALPFWEHSRLPDLVRACRRAGVEFRLVPDLYELSFDRVDIGNIGSVPLIALKELSLKGLNLLIKRAMDITLVLLTAPLVLPLMGVLALLVRRDSPGPAIFRQQRVGKGGRLFTVYKFRTMVQDAEERKAELAALNEADGPLFKMRDDPRRTRFGAFLRKYSLDELPQLWNILLGDMSLVGPRPPTPDEVDRYQDWHKRRLEVTPGLTGLWQVLGRSDTSFDEMVRLDIYYAENWSPMMDLRIMLQTVPVVVSAKGAY